MIKQLLGFLLLSFSCVSMAASLSARVNRSKVSLGETVTLTVSVNESSSKNLTLTALNKDFQVFGTSRRSQISLVNGQQQAQTEWRIELLAKRKGPLTIPALSLGKLKTQAIHLQVSAAKKTPGGLDAAVVPNIFFESSIAPKTGVVDSQLLYTLKLYYAMSVHNETLTPPLSKETTLEKLGEPRHYVSHHQGRPYEVFEQQFVAFPNKPGTLTFQAPVLSGVVADRQLARRQFGSFSMQPIGKPIRLVGQAVTVKVLAKPVSATVNWLPAQSLTLSENWGDDTAQWRVGQPHTRTLSIKAVGLKAQVLPTLVSSRDIEGVKDYPDKAKLEDKRSDSGTIGSRTEKIAYIPTQPGQFMLPAINIKWWDVLRKQFQVARLPAKHITVLANAANTPPISPDKTLPIGSTNMAVVTAKTEAAPAISWVYLALLIACCIILVLLVLLRRQSRDQKSKQQDDSLQSEKKCRAAIKQACFAGDAKATGMALLNWARVSYPGQAFFSMSDLKRLFSDEAVLEALRRLDQVLYTLDSQPWDGRAFWLAFTDALQQPSQRAPQKKAGDLPALHLK